MGLHPKANLLVQLTSVVGMYFLLSFGLPIILRYMGRKKGYVKNLLAIRSISFRLPTYKNTVFAIFLIHFVVLFYLSNDIRGLYSFAGSEFEWRYPHDIVAYMKSTEADKWAEICLLEGAEHGIMRIPYLKLQDVYKKKYIGVSMSQYNEIFSQNADVKANQILLCYQRFPKDLNGIELEKSMKLQIGNENKIYNITKRKSEILVVGYSDFDMIVFADNEYKTLDRSLKAMDVMILQDIQMDKQSVIQRRAQDFKKKNLESIWIIKKNALVAEETASRAFDMINILMGIIFLIVSITMFSVKFYIDIPHMKIKYKFFRDIGMRGKQMRKELHRETMQMIWIPAVSAIIIAGIYEAEMVCQFLLSNGGDISAIGGSMIAWLCQILGGWLGVVVVFVIIHIIYGKFILRYLNSKILPDKIEEKRIYDEG